MEISMRYKMKASDLAIVIETVKYLAKATPKKRNLVECACEDMEEMAEMDGTDVISLVMGVGKDDNYPDEHHGDGGRMMDYGHTKSDSHEGRMTKAKLFRMAQMAQRLHDKLVDADDLPEWVQDKVTTAEDRLASAHDYILYKVWRMNNEK